MRAKRWADTPLGPTETWPQSLKTVVRIMLTSRFAMWMGWGDDLSFFYNNAYRPTLGIKHGWALGSSAREVWREIWPDIGPRIEHVLRSGEATWDAGLRLFLERRGYPEETYHTFSYSPLADDTGAIVGMLCVVTEETERVIGERRLATLNGLASDVAGTNTRAEVLSAIKRQLGANTRDLPFTLTYLFDKQGKANLACTTGVDEGHAIAPVSIDPAGAQVIWPLDQLLAQQTMLTVGDLDQRFGQVPTGAWDRPPEEVVIAPIGRPGQNLLAGFFVAAVNPLRPSDETEFGFLNLIAGQLASGFANADAYEEARRRAEALAEIDRAKTTFFSNVSHEFRTPLTLMLGPLEELMTSPARGDPAASQALVHTAHRNALRLLKLVNSLLDFSRIEAGRLKANYEAVDLSSFTADLASVFRSAVDKAGLRLIINCPPLPQPVYVDRDMWEKIVLNLLSNAFKFTFEGEIEVAVKSAADGAAAELTVRDTGTGIPLDELPRLFDRFHRVEGALGRTFEGSGIGLALVQELAKLHGGLVTARSEFGHGSTFSVTIPWGSVTIPLGSVTVPSGSVTVPFGDRHRPDDRTGSRHGSTLAGVRAQAYVEEALRWLPGEDGTAPGAAMDAPSRSGADDLGEPPAAKVASGRVLLADDNTDMREYVRRLLTEHGYTVEAVGDGKAAIAAARRQPPDLVLSDVMMPGLDGFGLVRALRDDQVLREVPIVLLSARAGEEARVEGIEGGADDYLTKPFSARELLARVSANLKLARLRTEATEALRARTIELETVLATVPAAVWYTKDLSARHILGNHHAAALLRIAGQTDGSLLGPAADGAPFRVFREVGGVRPDTDAMHRALDGEEVRDEELKLQFEDGTSITMLTHANPLRDVAGRIVGAVCAGIDISSQKRMQERYRQAVEAAPNAMVIIRATGQIETVNTQAERLFGYSRQELLGQSVEILLPERFRGHHPGLRTAFFDGPVARPMGAGRDLFGFKKDGSEFPIEIGLSPIETDEGTIVISAVIDLSERATAAQALAQSEAEFRASFEAAAVGKILSDPVSRRIVRANRAFANMVGHALEELPGRTCPEFIWHEDLALDAADFAQLNGERTEPVGREMRYLRRDGSPFWVRTSATIARTAGNSGRAIVVRAIEDIDTRYKAETALKEAKRALEQVVAERTEALSQRDLLLREVYHRVKNNLQLVDSLLMMQGRTIEDPQAKQALLSLRSRISALGLVHQQLMGSSDLRTFDVSPFLDDLLQNILDSGGTGSVRLLVEACTLEVNLDFAVPLGLLVTELVTNSLKHAFPGGRGTISVVLERDVDGGLVLTVSDDGVGAAGSVANPKPGQGLGARIIKALVSQLGGHMVVRAENGMTTEIKIAVPELT